MVYSRGKALEEQKRIVGGTLRKIEHCTMEQRKKPGASNIQQKKIETNIENIVRIQNVYDSNNVLYVTFISKESVEY